MFFFSVHWLERNFLFISNYLSYILQLPFLCDLCEACLVVLFGATALTKRVDFKKNPSLW